MVDDEKSFSIDEKIISLEACEIINAFTGSSDGLTLGEYERRLKKYDYNEPANKIKRPIVLRFLSRLLNPLALTLITISLFTYFFAEKMTAFFIIGMAFMSAIIEFIQEEKASHEAEKLIEMVRVKTCVVREGKEHHVSTRNIVLGDIIKLKAGDLVPADLRLVETNDLFVNQSTFTGESFPVQKTSEPIPNKKPTLNQCSNLVFMGSSIVSGTATGVVVLAGKETEFGKLAGELNREEGISTFDRGVKDFTLMMMRLLLILGIVVFLINFLVKGDFSNALIFALAVAVGLTPDMLPMVVALNLSRGARSMAKKDVIVKKLKAMQNFGAIDVLCTDKTGTLTLDKVVLMQHKDPLGNEDEDVLRFAYINSFYQTGLNNLLDKAVLDHKHLLIKDYKKIYEIPFDFERRILSVVVKHDGEELLISKGAPEEIFKRSKSYYSNGEIHSISPDMKKKVHKEYDILSKDGFRVLALGYKEIKGGDAQKKYSKEDEYDLIFKGYVAFLDPPKPDAEETIKILQDYGISLKILSGDNEFVTEKVCQEVHLPYKYTITGDELLKTSDAELKKHIKDITIFSRLDPMQKERVIRLLQEQGHTVGFLGDGINDAPALKAADVGISVNNAAGAAKDTADIILLKKNLSVLCDCVVEGRKSFVNILKYLKMGASSNYGNMFSVTGASLLLPFLPMMPAQILLNNFLYDISQTSLPSDNVDLEEIRKPRKWDIGFIKKYILYMGPISSIFDFATFALLWFVFRANVSESASVFHTGWFIESLCTQIFVVYIIRTNKVPFLQSRPNKWVVIMTLSLIAIGISFALSSYGKLLGFTSLPWSYFVWLMVIVVIYLTTIQRAKSWFLAKFSKII